MAYAEDKEPTGLTDKATPVDADVVIIGDSADASEVAKKVTWSNVKATLKTYFDTLYQSVLTGLTASVAELNIMDGVTASTAEINYVDGVTSNIQTQLDAKLTIANIDDVAVNGETAAPISSNWAYDHENSTTAHGATGANVGTTNTQTLTNKRVTKRTGSTSSSATPTINTDNVDEYYITAQAADITSFTTNLSGTPTEGQLLFIAITGTAARAITWGASFENGPVALPTTTVTTTRLDVLFKWNTVTSKWRCMATGSTA